MSKAGDQLFRNKLRLYLVRWNEHRCLTHRPSLLGRHNGHNVNSAGDVWPTALRSGIRRPRLKLG